MSKYEPLWQHLQSNGSPTLKLTYDEIKDILGFDIDHSFLTYKKEAAQFGYQVGKISMKEKHVMFIKVGEKESSEVVVVENITEKDLQEAHRALSSVLHKCEKCQESVKDHPSQRTLLKNRIAALKVALALIEKEQNQ